MLDKIINHIVDRWDKPHWAMYEYPCCTEVICSNCGYELEPEIEEKREEGDYEIEVLVYHTTKRCPCCNAKMRNWRKPWWT